MAEAEERTDFQESIPSKISRKELGTEDIKIYIVPGRIQTKRLEILKNCARRNNYNVHTKFSTELTHLLTEFETKEQVVRALQLQSETALSSLNIVSTQWLIDSVKQKHPITEKEQLIFYQLKSEIKSPTKTHEMSETGIKNVFSVKDFPSYACQRKSSLHHHNKKLVGALEVLAKHADYRDGDVERDYSRSLAFCKAIAVIKCLPFEVTSKSQIEKLTDIGEHSMRIIEEILEDGISKEVEEILCSEWYQTMELFTGIYGVGPSISKQLFNDGLRSIEDIKEKYDELHIIRKRRSVSYGLAFYEDLNNVVCINEAKTLQSFLTAEAEAILPGVIVELTGGFRRGKMTGHDADFLFSHPLEGAETGFLTKLHNSLSSKGLILHSNYYKPYAENKHHQSSNRPMTMDDFEKFFLVCKFPKSGYTLESLTGSDRSHISASSYHELEKLSCQPRNWKAIRVDLIVCPAIQHAYALVGWTGNKHFNRSLRSYAKKELNMKLTSHGLWSYSTQTLIPASTEEDVFTNLNLQYLEPCERNA